VSIIVVAVTFFGGWALTYPSPDPKSIKYVLWKADLYKLSLDEATGTMVGDNPETFADLDGHRGQTIPGAATQACNDNANSPAKQGEGHPPPQKNGTGTDNSATQQAQQAAQQQKQAHEGFSVGLQVGGNAALGVGKAALGANGSAGVVPIQIDATTKHPNVAAEASGGVLATEGPHVAGHPHRTAAIRQLERSQAWREVFS
jgi:hypothetical protein